MLRELQLLKLSNLIFKQLKAMKAINFIKGWHFGALSFFTAIFFIIFFIDRGFSFLPIVLFFMAIAFAMIEESLNIAEIEARAVAISSNAKCYVVLDDVRDEMPGYNGITFVRMITFNKQEAVDCKKQLIEIWESCDNRPNLSEDKNDLIRIDAYGERFQVFRIEEHQMSIMLR